MGGTVFAGVLRDNELKGRGCGCGGEVNKLSAALSRSALEPVNESISSPNRSSSSRPVYATGRTGHRVCIRQVAHRTSFPVYLLTS